MQRKKNVLYERALRITYGDKTSSFNETSEKDNSVFYASLKLANIGNGNVQNIQ